MSVCFWSLQTTMDTLETDKVVMVSVVHLLKNLGTLIFIDKLWRVPRFLYL